MATWIHIHGDDGVLTRRLASHMLAYWGLDHVLMTDMCACSIGLDLSVSKPKLFINDVDACLDVSGQMEMHRDNTVQDWLWIEALPSILAPPIVEALRSEFRSRDAFRQRVRRQAAAATSMETQAPLFEVPRPYRRKY